ncbi:hypothetical protein D9611_004200 [Ephemerocybe angulata]|uniref:F-box domain-containing protein n=1 Tax=Ephemerocybe angulata TaxID=980116 RepID=A0A8H5F5J7_9AGAR|nr:hypothetical protein D9611_004200 [Tulosesus angulatus]
MADSQLIHDTLPVEVLQEIFILTSSIETQRNGRLLFRNRFCPLNFGRICKAWRAIAWSTPSLWSALEISAAGDSDKNLETNIPLVQEWLDRAKTCPLSISLSSPSHLSDKCDVLVRTLVACSKTWIYMDLCLPFGWSFNIRNIMASSEMPLLQTLFIEGHASSHAFSGAKALSKVVIAGQGYHSFCPLQRFPLAFLGSGSLTYGEFRNALVMVPRLRVFEGTIFGSARDEENTSLQPHHLSELSIRQGRPQTADFVALLHSIRLPSLSTLRLSQTDSAMDLGLTTDSFLGGVLNRWKCQLTTLMLGPMTLPEEGLIHALNALPTLRHLTLIDLRKCLRGSTEARWLDLSHLLYTSSTFLPSLDTLRLGEFDYPSNFPPRMTIFFERIKAFRTVENFPLRSSDLPFKIVLLQRYSEKWW